MRNMRSLVRFRGAYTRIDIYYIHNWWCIFFSVFHCVILACHNKQIHRMRKKCVWTAMLNANMNLICFPFFFVWFHFVPKMKHASYSPKNGLNRTHFCFGCLIWLDVALRLIFLFVSFFFSFRFSFGL